MPIYEYKCLKCNHEFEAVQKFSEAPVRQCSVCGGPVKKLISRSSFHLKGSGWYLTDYAKKNTPADSRSSSEPAKASSDSSSSDDD
ncbi:MAG: FmdB family zinc ribbon protein [Desulfomonilia bacterium]|jgi:putative FmdB family regulatory protein|uniref:Zinc ribbon domain protein n=1 Tax=anaerobic digester metagenome TaxID=1263854 RepID=A0A485M349_9ZZZZ|nr:zinc ribbon domain-containing protein [Pseudomonadota bacterium]HON37732.1 zinc ribbon domain-containing protein [Deltaproteobacteria bacterium]HRS55173.1 zinc ribbon domain-containing protein [Desulfomonilia bacterium]HPD20339.1 zinc ribbon domain-containing protein [Deltaproteobacteria bacterium]HPX17204.1 zinc ribbon domain-containing protein [Deltaproteobacteria bacterium]